MLYGVVLCFALHSFLPFPLFCVAFAFASAFAYAFVFAFVFCLRFCSPRLLVLLASVSVFTSASVSADGFACVDPTILASVSVSASVSLSLSLLL